MGSDNWVAHCILVNDDTHFPGALEGDDVRILGDSKVGLHSNRHFQMSKIINIFFLNFFRSNEHNNEKKKFGMETPLKLHV